MKRDWLPTPPPHHLLAACGLRAIHGHLHELFKKSGDTLIRKFRENEWIREGDRILDVECKSGVFAQVLLDEPIGKYVGLEYDAEIVEWYTNEVTQRDPRFQFVMFEQVVAAAANGTPSPLEPHSFDLVLLNSIFTRSPLDVAEEYLSQIGPVLAPAGRVLANVYFAIGASYDQPGFSFYSPKDFKQIVEAAGLQHDLPDEPFTGRLENWIVLRAKDAPNNSTSQA